ncbi:MULTISPECIES: hypothetical protein [Planococcus]|uniref:Uncharacterized protein n=2 Tax=Planococcus TaxID=1372 RepID=A0ABM5WT28_9BACL|nr:MULTISPECIES: hypothetical protein [Planococcus]ALS77480.1 hypothetical protein AUO94_01960 [Planococcus kocurii]AQU80636.1 hypothetical protein AJGP001_15660 [Planococcus faecalis]KAA0959138.1 hypothetical protein FQ085_05300 [Planococcus sp. ANT_H30]MDJ0330067.1 hypothetical protein [Planococcus sp. S3-L1]OHX55638.1 hypothetical protein BB777_00235 [Planococcus faecalis]
MSFFLVGILLWSLVILSVVLAIIGFWRGSWQALAWSGIALLPPMLLIYMGGDGVWFQFGILLPILLLVAAFLMKQQKTPNS